MMNQLLLFFPVIVPVIAPPIAPFYCRRCPSKQVTSCITSNSVRSAGTIFITTGSGKNILKIIFTEQFFIKATIFCCLDVFSVRPSQIFQVQVKIPTMCLCFQTIFPFLVTDTIHQQNFLLIVKIIFNFEGSRSKYTRKIQIFIDCEPNL